MPAPPDAPVVTPPEAARVFARGLVLAQLGFRASLDLQAAHPRARVLHAELQEWLRTREFTLELEALEQGRLAAPLGELTRHEVLECSSEFEAAAIMGWALGFLELPELPRPVSGGMVHTAFGLEDPGLMRRRLEALRLRPPPELARAARRLELACQRLEAQGEASEAWLHEAEGLGLPLIQGDLALAGAPASEHPEAGALARTLEPRRRALRWLRGGCLFYSHGRPPGPLSLRRLAG